MSVNESSVVIIVMISIMALLIIMRMTMMTCFFVRVGLKRDAEQSS